MLYKLIHSFHKPVKKVMAIKGGKEGVKKFLEMKIEKCVQTKMRIIRFQKIKKK